MVATNFVGQSFCRKKDGKEDETKVRKVREPKKRVQEVVEDDGEWETVGPGKPAKKLNKQEMKKMLFGKEVDEIDHAVIKERRDEIVSVRGKKTERSTNIENLKLLMQFAEEARLGVGIELMLLVDIITVIYEIPSAASCMKDDLWERYVLQIQLLASTISLLATSKEGPAALLRNLLIKEKREVGV